MPYGLLLIGGAIGKRGRCYKVNSGGAGREGPLRKSQLFRGAALWITGCDFSIGGLAPFMAEISAAVALEIS